MKMNTATITDPKFIIGLILSAAGVWWAFYDFEFESFKIAIFESEIIFIIIAIITLLLSVWIRAIRWNYLLSHEKNISTNLLCKVELIGYFGNNVLPLRLGEVLRSIILGKEINLPKSLVFGSIMLERILDMVGLIILSVLLIFTFDVSEEIRNLVYFGVVITLGVIVILFIIRKLFKNKLFGGQSSGIIKNLISGITGLKPELRIKSLIITIILWLIYWLNIHLVQEAFNLDMTITQSLLVLVISSLALSVPSAPGMIGTYHLAVNFAMEGILKFPSAIANPYTIVLHAYGFITLTLVGAYFFMQNQFHSHAISEVNLSTELINK